ncbi:hypothetical protein [Tahibacter sp.]|uniref:hypothetical protein n=1 Tax=Tahibacter sp. TaxID=2056211 RepID=UPI0028C4B17F|nr:hypothetical protein [Tahibacter sp.]
MKTTPAWRRWLLLSALFSLGLLYIGAFIVFRRDSRNFLDAVEEARALDHAAAHPISTLPQRMVFHTGNAECGYLGAGWWPAGPDGASLVRSPAQLLLPVVTRRDLRLDFTLDAYVPAPGASVTLTSRGVTLAHWRVGDQPRLTHTRVVLPAALQRDGMVALELHLQGPRKAWKGARAAKPGIEIWLLLRDLTISAADARASAPDPERET